MRGQVLLVGSWAVPESLLWRPRGADVDWIMTEEGVANYCQGYPNYTTRIIGDHMVLSAPDPAARIIEIEIAYEGSTGRELMELLPTTSVAPLHVLLALKLSHRFKRNSVHFEKTRGDILQLRHLGAEVPDYLREWLKRREKETLAHKAPVLAQAKSEFFTRSNLNYIYDHDSIHRAVALGERPAYLSFQKDGAEVMVDRGKWEALPREIQLHSVAEESMVLALERHQIPNDFRPAPAESFKMALQKVCTSISSGWWREFAWENYDAVLEAFGDVDYVGRFKTALAGGVVRPFEGGM